MPDLIDANVTTRTHTRTGELFRNSDDLAYDMEHTKRSLFVDVPSTTFTVTCVPSHGVFLESGGAWEPCTAGHDKPDLSEALINAWASLHHENRGFDDNLNRLTDATNATSTTVSSVAKLLRLHHRDERLRRMSPEARATYDRIRTLRTEIGPLDFDIVRAIREIRGDA